MTYVVVFQQVVGSPGSGYSIAYRTDAVVFLRRSDAISHGFKTRGSDDFNIAVYDKDGRLTSFDWMYEPIKNAPLAEISERLGWGPDPDADKEGT